ncbi:MAG: 4Fe-4S binding protein, partial [Desulfobacterales bacterium]
MMAMRNIVKIDEEKCDGCGLCVIECAEGALEIRDGKAKIIKEMYCDGLGACIGECPQEALTIVMEE